MTSKRKLITTFFLIIISCSKKIDPSIIATVGDSYITSKEYISAYSDRLIKTQVKDSEFERKRLLNELIRNKLFAQGARMKNLSLDSSANSMVELSKDQALRDALYEKIIGSKETLIKDSTIREHFKWKFTEVRLKHLFHQKKEVLDSLLFVIANEQNSFKNIAKFLFKNDILKDSGGDLGWVAYNTLDPNLEQVAFSIPLDTLVGPIRSSYGWHILIKTDERKQMIISEQDYQEGKQKLIRSISKKHAQIKANNYINDLMKKGIHINDSLVYKTLEQIGWIISKISDKDKINSKLVTGDQIKDEVLDLKLNQDAILATFNDGDFNVGDLLSGLRESRPNIFLKDPIQSFYIALRDKILTSTAISEGLLDDNSVKWATQSTEDNYLARSYLLFLKRDSNKKNFSTDELKEVSDELKKKVSINIFPENLNKLFANP